MGSPTLDDEPGTAGAIVNIDTAGMLESLSQLASTPGTPAGAIVQVLSSLNFNHDNRKETEETNKAREASGKETRKRSVDQTVWPCEQCSNSYRSESSLKRHVKTAHAKRQRLVETNLYECDDCDFAYANQAALDAHMDTHASSSKSPKHKCDFCTRERTSIYVHYCSYHKIEYPEQVIFENGNVLVISDINTDGGKAGWFLKEKEKIKLYKDETCRLCEVEMVFDNTEYLAAHYTMYHMVDPSMLENVKHVFRAEKGAHLIDLPTSHTPKRKPTDISAVKEKVPIRADGTKTQNSEKTKFKTPVESAVRAVFSCKECNIIFDNEVLLDKHKIEKHGPKIGVKKPECALCFKEVLQIYKHYGNVHNIEYPEQMLFENGNVLVLTDIHTNGGTAPWFISERGKAEIKYTLSTCRLCEIEYGNTGLLEMHYLSEHKVRPEALIRLGNLRCLFRAEKGSHLVDLPASRAKKQHKVTTLQNTARPDKTDSKCNEAVKSDQSAQVTAGLVMYQCAECSVAATTCDASVEHAQLHHLPDYHPIPQTCDICNFAFEIQCFADHTLHHLSRNEYKIVKFHPSKLLDEWSDMFEGLSESHANRIKGSSVYQYTRRVKMNPDTSPGIPVYRCGKCELYVRPKDVEGHCYCKTACVDNQAPGHFCSDCEIYFYTSVGLTEHEKHHKQYGEDCFRKVTFNCREDELINRALQTLQSAKSDESPVTQAKNKPSIKVIEDVVLVYKVCGECKKSIVNSEYEAHAAMHEIKDPLGHDSSRIVLDKDAIQEQNCSNVNKEHNSDPQLNAMGTEGNVEGTVECWNSDNDSCKSLQVATYAVQVLENTPTAAVNATDQDDGTDAIEAETIEIFSAQDAPSQEIFSEPMASDLKRDLEHLGLAEFGVDKNQWAYIPNDYASKSFLELDNDNMGNTQFSSDSSDDKDAIARISQDTSRSYTNVVTTGNNSETLDTINTITETREDVDRINNNTGFVNTTKTTSGEMNRGNVANTTSLEIVPQNDLDLESRPSSRDILFRMLSDERNK